MFRIAMFALLALGLTASVAPAQVYYVRSPRVVYPAPVVYSAPVVTYSSPVVTSTPVVTYSAPVTYAAPVTYSEPVTTYSYYPATTVYSAPATTVYSAPVVYTPGVVTTRSYYGFGVFRPRGLYTQSYVLP